MSLSMLNNVTSISQSSNIDILSQLNNAQEIAVISWTDYFVTATQFQGTLTNEPDDTAGERRTLRLYPTRLLVHPQDLFHKRYYPTAINAITA